MLPPLCAVCGGGEGATTVAFAADPAEAPDESMKGQLPNTEWFCRHHVAAARALSNRSLETAIGLLLGDADTVVAASTASPAAEPVVRVRGGSQRER